MQSKRTGGGGGVNKLEIARYAIDRGLAKSKSNENLSFMQISIFKQSPYLFSSAGALLFCHNFPHFNGFFFVQFHIA